MASAASLGSLVRPMPPTLRHTSAETRPMAVARVTMRDRSKNQKPVERGRHLSKEAIQAVQAMKRASIADGCGDGADSSVGRVVELRIRRLLKSDMVAVLRELKSQGLALLALQVFEEVRKEHWYKPDLFIYADMIAVLAVGGFHEEVEKVCSYLKKEHLENGAADAHGFKPIFYALLRSGFSTMAVDCFRLMKLWEGKPDEETYRILVCGLEAAEEFDISAPIRQEAERYMGEPLKGLQIYHKTE